MLGRFLEVSIRAADVAESLAFYESLGFLQATTGDVRRGAYAVVTDGRLHLGLHAREFASPSLTWVHSGVSGYLSRLEALGIEPVFANLGEDSLHEFGFHDPAGQMITLIEARTFSPPDVPPAHVTRLGYFEEYGIPTSDLERSTAFWDALGFVAFDPVREPFPKVVAAGTGLNIGLYDVDLRAPVLTFSDPQMPERISSLRGQGLRFAERLPRGLDPRRNALLIAPEGTWLLLTESSE
jgi:catechol 2,3-dioxygenase-like lactoylglutathione lyase family enzyme